MEGLLEPEEVLFPFLEEEVTRSEGGGNGHAAKGSLPGPESYRGSGAD